MSNSSERPRAASAGSTSGRPVPMGGMPQAVFPSNAWTMRTPSAIVSTRMSAGRFASTTVVICRSPADTRPVIRIDRMAFSRSRPPRASRLLAMTSSTVWAAAGPASRARIRPESIERGIGRIVPPVAPTRGGRRGGGCHRLAANLW